MLHLDRQKFFDAVRSGPFTGKLTASQVAGMEDLLTAANAAGVTDPRHIAYMLATAFHETGQLMQPVRESFASSDQQARARLARRAYARSTPPHGHAYYGRGDVQLTWAENYARMGELLGIPLLKEPDLALNSAVSKRILVEGMTRGLSARGDFTGKALEDYFNATTDDPVGARRIVNGTDRAQQIAGYHAKFLAAVLQARTERPAPKQPPTTGSTKPPTGGALAALGGMLLAAAAFLLGRD